MTLFMKGIYRSSWVQAGQVYPVMEKIKKQNKQKTLTFVVAVISSHYHCGRATVVIWYIITCVSVSVSVRACLRACVRACVRVCVCVCITLWLYFAMPFTGWLFYGITLVS